MCEIEAKKEIIQLYLSRFMDESLFNIDDFDEIDINELAKFANEDEVH